jgi:hypothetical protein
MLMKNILASSNFKVWVIASAATIAFCTTDFCIASDHLDTPTIAIPSADVGGIYAWTAPGGRHLNLITVIVGHSFSEKLEYAFHVHSGREIGKTAAPVDISCLFQADGAIECRAGDDDIARGDPRNSPGIEDLYDHFQVFAGLRDGPFFNNVRGTRAAYTTAQTALKA